ncbi:glycoside hydrolase family 32 protein [Fictibacillus enclensis]|uniref:glycoside hydrolase family 32 protein n=1 Tax=Fictibacillus enclensis TaxID=1017270 RepID=UPI0024C07E86|nr:glycoside hydrolase family 32 protein [Fictibacillus enclensis]WHY73004.1 glycoside hydrolase family 32 protein [Fictibacillus enclensis]
MYNHPYRPQFHFSPKEKWMNDPNGLVYYDGEYHLFYQYHPESTVWGPMHWGHAVSPDLIHWEELPVALYPDELGMIFSGCAVVDRDNTSGLKEGEEDVLVAFYTQHEENNEKQSLAYSHDRGRTWIKYDQNPVIANPDMKDFRDPKVFWSQENAKWIMCLAAGDEIQFYESSNLINWEYLSSFGNDFGAHGGVWECPDLFQLKVDGTDTKKWVLIVSINPGGPNGGSATQYFVGEFDGKAFHPDEGPADIRWADGGKDFYAAVSWSNTEVERKIWIGWMSNWQYANEVPTDPWRSAMSLPRELGLKMTESGWCLTQKVVKEFDNIKEEKLNTYENVVVKDEQPFVFPSKDELFELKLKPKNIAPDTKEWGIVLRKGEKTETCVTYSRVNRQWSVDRRRSGAIDFSEHFPSLDAAVATRQHTDHYVQLILDACSLELFAGDGELMMTELLFPFDEDFTMQVYSVGGEVAFEEVKLTRLKSIWNPKA